MLVSRSQRAVARLRDGDWVRGAIVHGTAVEGLHGRKAFAAYLAPLSRKNWFVYAKPPFAGPEAVLAYLARYTHRVAISNTRPHCSRRARRDLPLQGLPPRQAGAVSRDGAQRRRVYQRFLLHVLPKGFHRIRHYGLLASAGCKANIARAKQLIAVPISGG